MGDLCLDLLFVHKSKKKKSLLHFEERYELLGKNKSIMSSCFGRTSQWGVPQRVHDATAEENLLSSFLICSTNVEYCSHDNPQS